MSSGIHSPALFRRGLLRWFDGAKRDLPWRHTRDPYAIWISEVMLQQTQVATVIPYYERFLRRFPDAAALAHAPLPEVLSLWRGLGYYSRARNLHRAAQQIAGHGMPQTAQALRALPGFGRYTAAAVASLAFGEPVAVLDGNVARVLARLGAIREPLEYPAVREELWDEAGRLLEPRRPGAFNEAMMELGATVCTPSAPKCAVCPVRRFCGAAALGLQASIPPPRKRVARKSLALACAVVRSGSRILLARRAEEGLFGGLWELPCVEWDGRGAPADALRNGLGMAPTDAAELAPVRRTLTHRDLELRLVPCRAPRRRLSGYVEQRAFAAGELEALGISTAMAHAIGRCLG